MVASWRPGPGPGVIYLCGLTYRRGTYWASSSHPGVTSAYLYMKLICGDFVPNNLRLCPALAPSPPTPASHITACRHCEPGHQVTLSLSPSLIDTTGPLVMLQGCRCYWRLPGGATDRRPPPPPGPGGPVVARPEDRPPGAGCPLALVLEDIHH